MVIVLMIRPLSVRAGGEQGPLISEKFQTCLSQTTWTSVSQLTLSENEAIIARPILKEIKDRLTFPTRVLTI